MTVFVEPTRAAVVVALLVGSCGSSKGTDKDAIPVDGRGSQEGSAPFGLTQYGFYEATSYANPAGMNLAKEGQE
jgi:hypothetical protein